MKIMIHLIRVWDNERGLTNRLVNKTVMITREELRSTR